ncbi:hypothetical protein HYU95_05445 [Candidatus Daviesbacteria bacterium]|nr:hypothetical protein [Candidatus Daviesbacteria bacterium]
MKLYNKCIIYFRIDLEAVLKDLVAKAHQNAFGHIKLILHRLVDNNHLDLRKPYILIMLHL